jgi:hypothetical protein
MKMKNIYTVLTSSDAGLTCRVFGHFRERSDADQAVDDLLLCGVYDRVWIQHSYLDAPGNPVKHDIVIHY